MTPKVYTIVKQNSGISGYYVEILVDEDDDISTLPVQPQCATGSIATVIANGNVYVLNNKGEWVLQSYGGGGGEIPDANVIIARAVAQAVERIVANAPSSLDTLEKIANWINGQEGQNTQVNSQLQDILNFINDFAPYTPEEIASLFN